MNLRRTLALLAVAVFYLGTSAQAATRAVPSQYSTLRAALESATSGDVITIAPGTYQESGLDVPSGVTIEGTGAKPQDVMLDGGGQAPATGEFSESSSGALPAWNSASPCSRASTR